MTSLRTDIANSLAAKIATLSTIKTVNIDPIRLAASDFSEFELPCVQIIDSQETNLHEQVRGKKTWNLSIEIIIGPSSSSVPRQTDLWDLMEAIEQIIFEDPKLGEPSVIHARLIGSMTDLHLLSPLYIGKIDLQIDYYQALVRSC
jgi:hypothetical protein